MTSRTFYETLYILKHGVWVVGRETVKFPYGLYRLFIRLCPVPKTSDACSIATKYLNCSLLFILHVMNGDGDFETYSRLIFPSFLGTVNPVVSFIELNYIIEVR